MPDTLPVPEATSIDRLKAEVERLRVANRDLHRRLQKQEGPFQSRIAHVEDGIARHRNWTMAAQQELRVALERTASAQGEVARLTALTEELQGLLTTHEICGARLARQRDAAVEALEQIEAKDITGYSVDANGVERTQGPHGRVASKALAQIREASDAG